MTDMIMMRDESRAIKTGGTNTPRDPVGTSQQASLAAASARVLMQVREIVREVLYCQLEGVPCRGGVKGEAMAVSEHRYISLKHSY